MQHNTQQCMVVAYTRCTYITYNSHIHQMHQIQSTYTADTIHIYIRYNPYMHQLESTHISDTFHTYSCHQAAGQRWFRQSMYVCVGMRSCARGGSRTHHIEQGQVDHGQDDYKLTSQDKEGEIEKERGSAQFLQCCSLSLFSGYWT